VTHSARLAAGVLAALFLALHLPFLPPSLEDLDSINFALGIRDFDVSEHQPHPPGYPLYILAAKAVHGVVGPEVRALSLLSVVAGSLVLLALFKLFSELDRDRPDSPYTTLAALLAAVCPLFWVTAARPLSDMPGLAAALGVQVLILASRTPGALAVAALCAAFAAGLRSQVVWLTLPLLVYKAARIRQVLGLNQLATLALAYLAGALLWFVPLILVSGGPEAYFNALLNQGTEDLTGVKMLATTPTAGQLVTAFDYGFLAPWGPLAAGCVVVALAAAGVGATYRRSRPALVILVVAFGPYLLFDRFFQENITTRYALPLVVPTAYLAIRGLALLGQTAGILGALALVGFCVYVDDAAIYQYSRMEAPAFRMLADMHESARKNPGPQDPVLAMHRREYFDMRRPVVWVGDKMPTTRALQAPPKHEWLELVKYWNGGGRAPVWFIADPLRSDLALVRHPGRPVTYRWPLQLPKLIGGVRPNIMDWHTIERPDWYLGEGWSVTPETAGIAKEDGRGPGFAAITGWVRRWPQSTTLMVGGRNLGISGRPAQVRVALDGHSVDELIVNPGFFLRMKKLPPLTGEGEYATITVSSDNKDLAVEQFDAQPVGRVVFGFGEGWHEQEYNPATGALWRWTTERAVLRVRAQGRRVALTLRGEIEEASTSHIAVRVGERVAAQFDVGREFARTAIIPAELLDAEESAISIESSAWYVPAERRWRSNDQRRLALKLYECRITPVS
jgi:hypothetical protein